jgi:pimeloyl-ACP methyl ester carboxylesterase
LTWPQQGGAQKATPSPTPSNPATVAVLNPQGATLSSITDGDAVKLKVTMSQVADIAVVASFTFADDQRQIGRCIITHNNQSCETEVTPALGWYWGKGGKPLGEREIRAEHGDAGLPDLLKFSATTKLRISPRPVVLVHGLASNAATWANYTQPGGYLATLGLRGFAVGDGQAEGALSTGEVAQPARQTNTIAQNAEALSRYIAGVKRATGAQMVDIVAHSMGGLISRYYLDRLTTDRDVAQLLMIGSPHGGTACATLPASLGFYLPATLELRPAYLREVFNRQITRRRGAPFYQFAGTQIVESFKAPCTATPSDLVVSRASVAAITAEVAEAPLLHTDMTRSELIFKNFIQPHLQRQAGEFAAAPDPPPPAFVSAPEQFTKVFTGHVAAGGSSEMNVYLDQVALASFALLDPTRSLKVTVLGASGDVINLTPAANGLIQVNDPETMVTLGYGFDNPKPGPWRVTLEATPQTPPGGADYALSAKVVGGATLRTQADRMVVQEDLPITISASLDLAERPLPGAVLQASIRGPDGGVEQINFTDSGNEKRAVWTPKATGIYAADIHARGFSPDGLQIERADFLSFEVQPDPKRGLWTLALLGLGAIAVVTVIAFWLWQRWTNRTG